MQFILILLNTQEFELIVFQKTHINDNGYLG